MHSDNLVGLQDICVESIEGHIHSFAHASEDDIKATKELMGAL
jgi:hypothetical protein